MGKQEFISSLGKIEVERNTLFIKNLDWHFHHSILYELGRPLFWVAAALLNFFAGDNMVDTVGAGLFATLAVMNGYPLYDILFKRSLSTRIPLQRIISVETQPGGSPLEISVILRLKSGRYKKIAFRKLENQSEPFTALISQHLAQIQTT